MVCTSLTISTFFIASWKSSILKVKTRKRTRGYNSVGCFLTWQRWAWRHMSGILWCGNWDRQKSHRFQFKGSPSRGDQISSLSRQQRLSRRCAKEMRSPSTKKSWISMFKRTLTPQMLFVLMPAKYILTTENKKIPFGGNRGRHSRTNKQEQKLSYMYEPRMILFRRLNKGITSEQKAIKRTSSLICEFFLALSHELQSLITTTESNRQLKLTGTMPPNLALYLSTVTV